jgi:hypothetical protein
MAGEVAFSLDPKNDAPRLGRTPTDLVANNADALIRYIRCWHWTSLGWLSGYDKDNPAAARGAARIQMAFGYRFVIDEVRYLSRVKTGRKPAGFVCRSQHGFRAHVLQLAHRGKPAR